MQHIYEEIEHSKYLKDLPEDWDEQGAAAIDEALYEISRGGLSVEKTTQRPCGQSRQARMRLPRSVGSIHR
ncbi:MAG: hypothetical protein WD491_02845 [Balneolales bacterium]